MKTRFDSQRGLIIVNAEIVGVSATAIVRLALDTGATKTLLNAALLAALGYDAGASPTRV
jgi:predicted aspartyl protease